MKIKSGFILKEIAGENVLIFLTPELKNKVITLNDSGALLFKLISEGKSEKELVDAILEEYDTDEATASSDVKKFIDSLLSIGALED